MAKEIEKWNNVSKKSPLSIKKSFLEEIDFRMKDNYRNLAKQAFTKKDPDLPIRKIEERYKNKNIIESTRDVPDNSRYYQPTYLNNARNYKDVRYFSGFKKLVYFKEKGCSQEFYGCLEEINQTRQVYQDAIKSFYNENNIEVLPSIIRDYTTLMEAATKGKLTDIYNSKNWEVDQLCKIYYGTGYLQLHNSDDINDKRPTFDESWTDRCDMYGYVQTCYHFKNNFEKRFSLNYLEAHPAKDYTQDGEGGKTYPIPWKEKELRKTVLSQIILDKRNSENYAVAFYKMNLQGVQNLTVEQQKSLNAIYSSIEKCAEKIDRLDDKRIDTENKIKKSEQYSKEYDEYQNQLNSSFPLTGDPEEDDRISETYRKAMKIFENNLYSKYIEPDVEKIKIEMENLTQNFVSLGNSMEEFIQDPSRHKEIVQEIQALDLKDEGHVQEIKERVEAPQKTPEPQKAVQQERKPPVSSKEKENENIQKAEKKDTRTVVTRQDLNGLIQDKLAEKAPYLQESFQADPKHRFQTVKTFIQESEENRKLYQEARKEVLKDFTLDASEIRHSQKKEDTRQPITRKAYLEKIQEELAKRDPQLKASFDAQPEKKFQLVGQYIKSETGRKAYDEVRKEVTQQYTIEKTASHSHEKDNRQEISRSDYNQKIWDSLAQKDESLKTTLAQETDAKQKFQDVRAFIEKSPENKKVFEDIKQEILKDYTVKHPNQKLDSKTMNLAATADARIAYAKKYQVPGMDITTPLTKENGKAIWKQNGQAIANFLNDPNASNQEKIQRAKNWRLALESSKKKLAPERQQGQQKASQKKQNVDYDRGSMYH